MPLGIADPVAQRLIDGRTQRAIAAGDRHHGGAEQSHAPDVGRLALHVERAHVHRARQTDARTGRGARHAVLTGAGLGHDAPRAQPPRQQRLPERVVDLVRAGVRQILALEPHLARPSACDRCGAGLSAVGRPTQSRSSRCELGLKFGIGEPAARAALEPLVRGDQRLGHVAAAKGPVAPALVGIAAGQQLLERSRALSRRFRLPSCC